MNRRDRARWRNAQTMADCGELVIAWMNGEIKETPTHCGTPFDETITLTPVLTLANRAGFITDGSQLAERPSGPVPMGEGLAWNAWVDGFVSDEGLAGLREMASWTLLTLTACRGCVHECGARRDDWWFCPWKDSADFWDERCPRVRGELYACWFVCVSDPEPGRNDRLWPALEKWAEGAR